MNVERFYETLESAGTLDKTLALQTNLVAIRDALNNIASAPAQPQHQTALASAMAQFSAACDKLRQSLTPSQSEALLEIGGQDFFDPSMDEKIKHSIAENAMTPSVARDFVTDFVARRSSFMDTLRQTLSGLSQLEVRGAKLEPGNADLAFLIPWELFDDKLIDFAKELTFISRLIEALDEAMTGNHEPATLRGLSSSLPVVAVGTSLGLTMYLATMVNKFLEAWERVEKIRRIRAEMSEMGIQGPPIDVLTKQITATVRGVVEESVNTALANYEGAATRRNELENYLKRETRRLFGQIERGLKIQFSAQPTKDGNEADRKLLEDIARLGRELKFPTRTEDPLLLPNGEVLESDLQEPAPTPPARSAKATSRKADKAES